MHEFSIRYCEAYLDGAHPAEAKRIASAAGNDKPASEKEQAGENRESAQDTATPQGQKGPQGGPEAEATEMETEDQEEPPPSDHESEISTPRSEQSSIKSDEERMVGLEEVTAVTGGMILDTPQRQEAPSCPDDGPGTQDEPQEYRTLM